MPQNSMAITTSFGSGSRRSNENGSMGALGFLAAKPLDEIMDSPLTCRSKMRGNARGFFFLSGDSLAVCANRKLLVVVFARHVVFGNFVGDDFPFVSVRNIFDPFDHFGLEGVALFEKFIDAFGVRSGAIGKTLQVSGLAAGARAESRGFKRNGVDDLALAAFAYGRAIFRGSFGAEWFCRWLGVRLRQQFCLGALLRSGNLLDRRFFRGRFLHAFLRCFLRGSRGLFLGYFFGFLFGGHGESLALSGGAVYLGAALSYPLTTAARETNGRGESSRYEHRRSTSAHSRDWNYSGYTHGLGRGCALCGGRGVQRRDSHRRNYHDHSRGDR